MVRTSYTQFTVMVEFMERFGDLSKPSGGPHGRQHNLAKWKELTLKLNSEGSGDSRNDEKWRKVWSDFKNATKKKASKLKRSMSGTGGGPALKTCLTDLEQRVMAIMGEQAATGMQVVEVGGPKKVGFDQTNESHDINKQKTPQENSEIIYEIEIGDESWNKPGTSGDPTPFQPQELVLPSPSPPHTNPEESSSWNPSPPKKNKKKTDTVAMAFLQSEKNRDDKYFLLEQERIRQRDTELQIQAQWLEILKEVVKLLKDHLNKSS